MNCKQCGKKMNPAEAMLSSKHEICGKCTRKNHKKAVGKLTQDRPDIPSEIYDIEASVEMQMLYDDMGL
jgi:hypothetical protein